MSELRSDIDGARIVDLLRSMGIEDFKAVASIFIGPRTLSVEVLKRNSDGQFYADPDSGGREIAREVFLSVVRWPKEVLGG